MDTYQSKFNDNLEYQSLISLLCPTKINEISLHLGDEKRAPSQHNGKESDILLTRVYNQGKPSSGLKKHGRKSRGRPAGQTGTEGMKGKLQVFAPED